MLLLLAGWEVSTCDGGGEDETLRGLRGFCEARPEVQGSRLHGKG